MEKIFASPQRYVQGKNLLKTGISYVKNLGHAPMLLCDDIVWEIVGNEFSLTMKKNELSVTRVSFTGETSKNEIQRLLTILSQESCDCIIGLGGGKTIDTAKAIANQVDLPLAIVPTTAAPTSALSVIYSSDGLFKKYQFNKKSPELILVDTQVIAQAPSRFLASGIADGLATWVEAQAVMKGNGKMMAGGLPTIAAQAIACKCEEVLFTNGIQAMIACQSNLVTPALEAVIEANILLSGIGFESCGEAAAHSIHNGFAAIKGDIHRLTHGEKIAYATLVQLILENTPQDRIDQFIDFYQSIGLPTTLKELHLSSKNKEELLLIGQLATQENETIHQMGKNFSELEIADALLAVDSYVKWKNEQPNR